jgi:hypothetical protein
MRERRFFGHSRLPGVGTAILALVEATGCGSGGPAKPLDGAPLLRSDDAGLSWRPATPAGAPPWTVSAVVDAPDGRFLALVPDYGLVTFD